MSTQNCRLSLWNPAGSFSVKSLQTTYAKELKVFDKNRDGNFDGGELTGLKNSLREASKKDNKKSNLSDAELATWAKSIGTTPESLLEFMHDIDGGSLATQIYSNYNTYVMSAISASKAEQYIKRLNVKNIDFALKTYKSKCSGTSLVNTLCSGKINMKNATPLLRHVVETAAQAAKVKGKLSDSDLVQFNKALISGDKNAIKEYGNKICNSL